jgi:hypothetical protein
MDQFGSSQGPQPDLVTFWTVHSAFETFTLRFFALLMVR